MKSIFQLALSLGILLGGGTYAVKTAAEAIRDLAFTRISKGLSSTKKLNDALWKNSRGI